LKAIIFDMDGVIIDSEPIHFEVERALLEELGGTFDREFHESLVGTVDELMWSTFREKFDLSIPLNEIIELKKERFLNNLSRVPLVDGVTNLMSSLHKEGYSLALASSNNRKSVDAIIEKFGLDKYLHYSISGDDVEHGKPNPEIFLTAAKNMNVDPSECLVIEDAGNGVKAAKAASMKCIGFKNHNSGNQDLSEADLIINSYDEINLGDLRALFNGEVHDE